MRVSEAEYKQFVLEHPDEKWELHCGLLVKKPPMTYAHNFTMRTLGWLLERQLDRRDYEVIVDMGRVARPEESFFIPDVYVVPREMLRRLYRGDELEVFPEPLPLVAEVWSPSTGRYDVRTKLGEYQRRGDGELWLVHPRERRVTVWRRGPGGSYAETVHTSGTISVTSLPGVTID
jgi:Uma2 family endonuclease